MILYKRYDIVKHVFPSKRYKSNKIKVVKKDKAHIEFILVHPQPWATSNS